MYKLLIIILASTCFGSVRGQQKESADNPSKLYFKLYAGKGLLTPGSYRVNTTEGVFYTDADFNFHDTSRKSEGKHGLGHAFRIGGGIGIIQTDFLNIGLDVEWMMKEKSTNTINVTVNSANHGSATDKMSYNMMTLTPYMIFKALARPKFYIYNKLGVLLTLPFTLHTSGFSDNMSVIASIRRDNFLDGVLYPNSNYSFRGENQYSYDIKYKMSLGVGVNVAFGINYRIDDKLRVFGEIFGNYSGLSPATSTTKSSGTILEVQMIDTTNFHYESPQYSGSITTTHTTYKKDGEINYVGPEATARKYSINMSAIGINIGIVRRF